MQPPCMPTAKGLAPCELRCDPRSVYALTLTAVFACRGGSSQRAQDGTIEFVPDSSKARFIAEGAACLVWNNLPDVSAKEYVDEKTGNKALGSLAAQGSALAEADEDGVIDAHEKMDKAKGALSSLSEKFAFLSALAEKPTAFI